MVFVSINGQDCSKDTRPSPPPSALNSHLGRRLHCLALGGTGDVVLHMGPQVIHTGSLIRREPKLGVERKGGGEETEQRPCVVRTASCSGSRTRFRRRRRCGSRREEGTEGSATCYSSRCGGLLGEVRRVPCQPGVVVPRRRAAVGEGFGQRPVGQNRRQRDRGVNDHLGYDTQGTTGVLKS